MIKLLKHFFLTCTVISLGTSVLIESFDLQYADGSFGGVLFLISFITGFIRFLVQKNLSFISIKIQGGVIESILSVFLAIFLDFCMRIVVHRYCKRKTIHP